MYPAYTFLDLISSGDAEPKGAEEDKKQRKFTPYNPYITEKYTIYGKNILFHIQDEGLKNSIKPAAKLTKNIKSLTITA